MAVRADQEDPSLDALFEPVADGLDILVNNAAITAPAPIKDITPELFDKAMTVNAKFPLLAMQRAAPLLRDGGRIISISTLNTTAPGPGIALYCASKAALEQFSKVAAYELGPRGITVNTVSPGATDTDLLRASNPQKNWRRPPRSPPLAAWARLPISRTWSLSWPAPTPGGSPPRTSRPPAASTSDPGPGRRRPAGSAPAGSAPCEAQDGEEPEHHEDRRRPGQRQPDVVAGAVRRAAPGRGRPWRGRAPRRPSGSAAGSR